MSRTVTADTQELSQITITAKFHSNFSLRHMQTEMVNSAKTGTVIPCGFDCGNGFTKLHTVSGEIVIPSYFWRIAEGDINEYEGLGEGAAFEYLEGDRADLIGSKWLIGETARTYYPQGYQRIVDSWDNKITHGLQMLLGCIALMPQQSESNLYIVGSLHDSQAFGAKYKQNLAGNHVVKIGGRFCCLNITANITEEGIGALLISRAPGQRRVAMIDLGHGTTITSVFEGNKLLQNSRKIDTVGVHQLCESIANHLETRRRLGKAGNSHLIREGLKKHFQYGTTGWEFSEIYRTELKGWLQSCLVPAWKHLQARTDEIDAIYLIGGGASLPNVAAIAASQGIASIQDSQLANVRGLLKLAQLTKEVA